MVKRTPYKAETVDGLGGGKDKEERHESFGLVGFNRVSGSRHLFGSHLETHQHFVTMRVYRARLVHDSLSYDRYHADGRLPIVEVHMSAAQFAEAITTMNVGDGVPCTIDAVEGVSMDPVPREVVAENVKIREGFAESIQGVVEQAVTARDEFEKILDSKSTVSKSRARELLGVLNRVVTELRSNAPFVVSQFQESAEKVVTQAKAELEAFTMRALMRVEGQSLPEEVKKVLSPSIEED
jgi:hypothetical protein